MSDIEQKIERIEQAAKEAEGSFMVPAPIKAVLVDVVDVLKVLNERCKSDD